MYFSDRFASLSTVATRGIGLLRDAGGLRGAALSCVASSLSDMFVGTGDSPCSLHFSDAFETFMVQMLSDSLLTVIAAQQTPANYKDIDRSAA